MSRLRRLYFVSEHPLTMETVSYALRHGEVWTNRADADHFRCPYENLYAVELGDVTILRRASPVNSDASHQLTPEARPPATHTATETSTEEDLEATK